MIRDYTFLREAYPLQRVVEKLEKKDGRNVPRRGMVALIRWSPATLDPVGDTTSCVVAWLVNGEYDMDNIELFNGDQVVAMLKPGFGSMPKPYLDNPMVTHWLKPLQQNDWKMEESEFEAAMEKGKAEVARLNDLAAEESRKVKEANKRRQIQAGVFKLTEKQLHAAQQRQLQEQKKQEKAAAAAAAAAAAGGTKKEKKAAAAAAVGGVSKKTGKAAAAAAAATVGAKQKQPAAGAGAGTKGKAAAAGAGVQKRKPAAAVAKTKPAAAAATAAAPAPAPATAPAKKRKTEQQAGQEQGTKKQKQPAQK